MAKKKKTSKIAPRKAAAPASGPSWIEQLSKALDAVKNPKTRRTS